MVARRARERTDYIRNQSVYDALDALDHELGGRSATWHPEARNEPMPWILGMGGSVTILLSSILFLGGPAFMFFLFIAFGIGGTVLCYSGLQAAQEKNKAIDARNEASRRVFDSKKREQIELRKTILSTLKDMDMAEKNRDTSLHMSAMENETSRYQADRQVDVAKIQIRGQVEVAKWEAAGAGASREHLEQLEDKRYDYEALAAGNERNYLAREAQRDRQHEMEKLIERLDHELDMWKEKIERDYRAEPERMQEELDAWELEMAARESIEKEQDEDAKIRKIKAFERRLSRRSA